MHRFFASIYGKWFPWELTDGHMLLRGQTSMFGSLSMCRFAWYRFMGRSILKKVFNFTIFCLKQGYSNILMHFALNRVRIKEFQPQPNFL